MRCLTLLDGLRKLSGDIEVLFVCRAHSGHLADSIRERGYHVELLPSGSSLNLSEVKGEHASWLGELSCIDADQTSNAIQAHFGAKADWLIVDHYGIDKDWHRQLRDRTNHLMVIDDLANRQYDCDLLLDQTYGQDERAYKPLVPEHCKLLIGARYALLRPEFERARYESLKWRDQPRLNNILITMGGVDKDNATGRLLDALKVSCMPCDTTITVVMGAAAPWLKSVRQQAAALRWPVSVRVNVSNMAQLMAGCDLAIGAAGSTAWERCVLGVPTLMLVLADNQRKIAEGLECAKAAMLIENGASFDSRHLVNVLSDLEMNPLKLMEMSLAAREICHGDGVSKVARCFETGVL